MLVTSLYLNERKNEKRAKSEKKLEYIKFRRRVRMEKKDARKTHF